MSEQDGEEAAAEASAAQLPAQAEPGQFRHLGGSVSDQWNLMIGRQLARALPMRGRDEKSADSDFAGATLALAANKPKNEIEGMLLAQMIGMHAAAMEALRDAACSSQPLTRSEA